MKINEIIRAQRIKQELTQEQLATYLGVSAPAVNKWEKGTSYPDITLLPPLARLLHTDLNTLLSFQDSLTLQEINLFTSQLVTIAKEKGIQSACQTAMEKIKEYPSCDELILTSALTLEGIQTMYWHTLETLQSEEIEKLYERAAKSSNPAISQQAKSMLIYKYINREECDKAQNLIDTLPDPAVVDKNRIQTNLLLHQKDYEKAALLIEQRLLKESNQLYSDLIKLMEIAQEENRADDASYLSQTSKHLAQLLHHWEYNAYVPEFQLAILQKDAQKCLEAIKNMLPALLKEWKLDQSALYHHLPPKALKFNQELGTHLIPKLINELENPQNPEYAFLRKNKAFTAFIADFKAQNNWIDTSNNG